MKHILSVDVQKKDDEYVFTLHYDKRAIVWQVKSLGEGFRRVESRVKVEVGDENQTSDQNNK